MENYKITRLTDCPALKDRAADWFAGKWSVPLAAYQESMSEALAGTSPVPQWYLALDDVEIIGGLGVIENTFTAEKTLRQTYAPSMWKNRTAAGALPASF